MTNQILEDREGNIWVGTEKGLDRFRPATVRVAAALTSPAAFGDKLLAATDGTVYIGEAKTIYRVRPGGEPAGSGFSFSGSSVEHGQRTGLSAFSIM